MSTKEPQVAVVGIDVSQDWLDYHILPEGTRDRIANNEQGFQTLTKRLLP